MDPTPSSNSSFATTRWSVVLAACRSSSPHYEEALSSLCHTYWFPLYAYLRRRGYDPNQAEDYIQSFFAQMLEKQYLREVEPSRGKFRSFLLVALRRFVSDQHDRDQALKRGGGHNRLFIDLESAEGRYSLEPVSDLSPERVFEKSWALAVLEQTTARLEAEFKSMNKQKLFSRLRVYLGGEGDSAPYRNAAADLDMTEDAVKSAVYRLRRRYRQLLRNEIAQTVISNEQIDEEIQDLFAAVSS